MDFIKIDAESAEFEVLQGMNNIIAEMKPIITIEVGDAGIPEIRNSKDVVAWLLNKGYEAYEYSGKDIVRHKITDSYVYDNILFIPKVSDIGEQTAMK